MGEYPLLGVIAEPHRANEPAHLFPPDLGEIELLLVHPEGRANRGMKDALATPSGQKVARTGVAVVRFGVVRFHPPEDETDDVVLMLAVVGFLLGRGDDVIGLGETQT